MSTVHGLEHLNKVILVNENAKQYVIKEIWVHKKPDIDEIIAIWLLMKFGQKLFIDIEVAEIKFVDPAKVKGSYSELLAQGILAIGFGKGRFDEHQKESGDGERIRNKSAASLVAEALGIRN